MNQGSSVLDAVEQGIRLVEADTAIHSVGTGGWPNLLGEVELDASIMDGATRKCGSVGAVRGFLHPISIARKVMELLPHVMLVGDGAARFASEIGMAVGDNFTPETRKRWRCWLKENVSDESLSRWPYVPLVSLSRKTADPITSTGTTVFLVRNSESQMAVGVSTSGWSWKYPGRLGDSPVIGAGNYVDDRYGAAGCTGHGEMMIRAGTARSMVLYLKMGLSVEEACMEVLSDIRSMEIDFRYSATLYALDKFGNSFVATNDTSGEKNYWIWSDNMEEPKMRATVVVES